METTPQKYQAYVRQKQKKSPLAKDMALAFLVGGLICVLGQLILDAYTAAGLHQEDAATATSATLVFLSALFTGLNLYHRLARYGGAGTLVPITGFANAVVSPAIDFKTEGFVTGMAAKMFLVAGPVIVFGTVASTLYGLIIWLAGGEAVDSSASWIDLAENEGINWHFSQKTGKKLYLSSLEKYYIIPLLSDYVRIRTFSKNEGRKLNYDCQ